MSDRYRYSMLTKRPIFDIFIWLRLTMRQWNWKKSNKISKAKRCDRDTVKIQFSHHKYSTRTLNTKMRK